MNLVVAYVIFAVIATGVNIGVQELTVRAYSGAFSLSASVVAGTLAGMVCKYVLDKRYIFRFESRDLVHDTRTFMLYAVMSVVTTIIFWGFEFGFHWAFHSKEMRYLGGIIGLAIGYFLKYHLDRRYVFAKER
ncbi:GtrA family protein [Caldimonas thermodepolymerans]|jgi:Predicted membrane protein|uniref:GtrA family protein n=1 Tax=Caldimonas thermodepolymerans TaxID=215580 RepID=UPI0024909E3F|nr:GtrA family protein [Caldimonas thermodepolymerans]